MTIQQLFKYNYAYQIQETSFPALFATQETTLFYLPELGNTGINFVNKYRKKSIFNSVLLYPIYQFLVRKINAQPYIQEFKKKNPNVKIVRQAKHLTYVKGKINIIDLTLLMELYYMQAPVYRFKALYEVFGFINSLIKENNLKNPFILYHGNSEHTLFFNSFYKFLRKKQFKLDSEILDTNILGYGEIDKKIKLYPFNEYIKKEKIYKYRIPVLYLYKKEILNEVSQDDLDKVLEHELENKTIENIKNEDVLEKNIDEEVEKQLKDNIKDELQKLLKSNKLKDSIKKAKETQGVKDIADSVLDNVYQLLSRINSENSFDENINYLKEKYKNDKEFIKIVEKFNNYITELNKKYNGSIDLNEKLINKFTNLYYNPLDIIGTKTLNVYNRQKTEFDDVLDNAMHDLIKSIEKDKEAGIKILNISSEIIDTNKDRIKIYKIKVKNTKFGKQHQYNLELHVPYPVKGKYIKLGGNTYIMINQFYPKPILKVKPNLIRLYTHFNTSAVSLKTHLINEKQGMENIYKQFIKIFNKKININYYDTTEEEKNKLIVEKFNIDPNSIESFLNKKIEIKY